MPPTLPVEPRTDTEPGISSHLAAMRWVTEQDKSADDTPLKKALRDYFNDKPMKFLEEKNKLEAANRPVELEDVSTDHLLRLMDGLVERASHAVAGTVAQEGS
jgi:hypothetical protein